MNNDCAFFSVSGLKSQSSVTEVCLHIKEILWSVINNGSGVQFLSVFIQAVFDKVKQPCSGSPIYLIMRMITGQIRWHKVLFIINKKFAIIKAFFILPLLTKEVNHLAQWFCGVHCHPIKTSQNNNTTTRLKGGPNPLSGVLIPRPWEVVIPKNFSLLLVITWRHYHTEILLSQCIRAAECLRREFSFGGSGMI